MEVFGRITEKLAVKSGTSKATGKEWSTQSFVIDTGEDFNNILCVEMFGAEKIDELKKYQVGDGVNVNVNVSSNAWTNPKTKLTNYFTKASLWKMAKVEEEGVQEAPEESFEQEPSDLPF